MEIVTLFQPHHSQSYCGWFTTGCDLYVKPVGITAGPYRISRSDRLLGIPLKEFEAEIDVMGKKMYPGDGYIYHNIFELR